MRFKEWIVGSLGAVGLILFYLIQVVIIFIPLVFLGLPWWVDALLALFVLFVPFLNTIAALAIWIWSFIIVISSPITWVSIVYFICLAFHLVFEIIPVVISFIGSLFSHRY